MLELLMNHDGKLETWTFRGPLLIKNKVEIEQLHQNNNKNGLRPKESKKNIDTSRLAPPKATIYCHKPKVNSVRFEDPCDHINNMDNANDDTHLIKGICRGGGKFWIREREHNNWRRTRIIRKH